MWGSSVTCAGSRSQEGAGVYDRGRARIRTQAVRHLNPALDCHASRSTLHQLRAGKGAGDSGKGRRPLWWPSGFGSSERRGPRPAEERVWSVPRVWLCWPVPALVWTPAPSLGSSFRSCTGTSKWQMLLMLLGRPRESRAILAGSVSSPRAGQECLLSLT